MPTPFGAEIITDVNQETPNLAALRAKSPAHAIEYFFGQLFDFPNRMFFWDPAFWKASKSNFDGWAPVAGKHSLRHGRICQRAEPPKPGPDCRCNCPTGAPNAGGRIRRQNSSGSLVPDPLSLISSCFLLFQRVSVRIITPAFHVLPRFGGSFSRVLQR